ncbi:T9SS type A sorting domain-containing protein [Segetibacter sp. 3557_3]|uniref:T9SS type A sorting domain-containing protein n=1 Tax=Segetibacter sp. 3557_3 TaxID=2547429 RepID=UPI0010589C41|nr:T9SS type A sorting domain-containing protein [Segetibacter sp. 3557_3]TDH29316.1 T9SS type A sorting domain-containing protein [Segetibacter sp. 3557_3]
MNKLYLFTIVLLFSRTTAIAQPGTLDPTFGVGGVVQTRIGTGSFGNAMAIQADGKLVVGGRVIVNNSEDFGLARYNTDGSLDQTFNGNGTVSTPITQYGDVILGLAIQTDGKIVAAGFSNNLLSNEIALARYNPNGTLDSMFDSDGIIAPPHTLRGRVAYDVAIQSDGKIVIAGVTTPNTVSMFTARFNQNGSPDSSFGVNGMTTTSLGTDQARTLEIQSDGKILVGGHIAANETLNFGIIRYTTAGVPDSSFDDDGVVITDFAGSGAYINDLAVLADGKIVAAGFNYLGNSVNEFALARYNPDGSPDLSFDVDGKTTTRAVTANAIISSIDIQSDGKIVAGGYGGTQFDFVLARYHPEGNLDPTFGVNGVVHMSMSAQHDLIETVRIQGSRIYAAGWGSNNFVVAAFRKDAQALPLVLVNFVSVLNGIYVDCKWSTAAEMHTSHTIIQRSTNGINFSDLGRVLAQRGSSQYEFTDYTVSTLPDGAVVHYRLKMTDKDSSVTYSPTNTVRLGKQRFTISPNPAKDFIRVTGRQLKKAQILDNTGKLVLQLQPEGNQKLNISALPPGSYFLRAIDVNGAVTVQKLVIR